MIKRTPSRNARTRGFKVKNVLQICLLLGVCFWLIYQVKHSHDKKKEFDEKESKISVKTQSGDGISNLGRKGLHPRVPELPKDEKHEEDDDEGTILEEEVNKMEEYKREQKQVEDETKHEEEEEREEEGTKHEEEEREEGSKHEEEEREEEEEGSKHDMEEREEERNKLEDEEQEEETKNDETEDERRGGGTDEIDERDQEKIGEADLEEDFVDEGKEREEEGEEKESGHDEAGDKEAQVDDETSMEDQDHDEGVQNDHEAREEHYKADDASSAVHDTQTISTEPEKVSSENLEANDLELEKNSNNNNTNDVNGDQKNSKSQLGEGVTAENDSQLNMKAGEKMDDEIINTEDQSTKNATIVPVSNGQPELSNNSMDVNTEAGNETSSSSQHNEIGVTSDSNQAQNAKIATEEASNLKTTELEQVNSNTIADSGETDSNSSVPDKTENIDNSAKDSNSSTNSEPSGSDKLIKNEVKAEAEVKPDGSDKVTKPEVKADAEVNSGSSSTTKETADTAMDGNSDAKNELGGTEENKGSSATDGTEAVFHDHIDSSDSSVGQEEARINLDTLPENSGDGINSRDVAAE